MSRLVDGTVSLITALLSEQLTGCLPALSPPAIMLRVRGHIEYQLSDPGLSPDGIADALGISRRYRSSYSPRKTPPCPAGSASGA